MMIGRRNTTATWGALGAALLACVAAAATAPYDFTGHWTGMSQETGKAALSLTADLTSQAGTKHFNGTMAVADDPPLTCDVTGREKRNLKVKMRLACSGVVIRLHGTLDPATQTVTGGYVRPGRHKRHVGTFTLTRQPS